MLMFRAYDKETGSYWDDKFESYRGNLKHLLMGLDGTLFLWGVNSYAPLHESCFANKFIIEQWTTEIVQCNCKVFVNDILMDNDNMLYWVKFGKLPLDRIYDCLCTYPAFYLQCFGKVGRSPWYECQEINKYMKVIGNIHHDFKVLGFDKDPTSEGIK